MGSVRRRAGGVRVGLDDPEVVLLAGLVGQVRALLVAELPEGLVDGTADPLQALTALRTTQLTAPDDPVMLRLLPDAYRDDPDASGEYRRLMDADLRLQKAAALERILDDLSDGGVRKGGELRVQLDDAAAQQWLYGINDVRLALGTTLDVKEDMEAERAALEPGSQRDLQLGIYDWVTWLQDAIVRAVSSG
jgi:hypothetical protein